MRAIVSKSYFNWRLIIFFIILTYHIETVGKENKEVTLKKIFEITRDIANLGFGEKDIHEIAKDEDLYIRYEEWRKSNKI